MDGYYDQDYELPPYGQQWGAEGASGTTTMYGQDSAAPMTPPPSRAHKMSENKSTSGSALGMVNDLGGGASSPYGVDYEGAYV
jgi:hypothetical protein